MTVDPVEIDGGPMRVPGFRRLLTAMSVSSLGTFLQLTAAPWHS